jgi:hypothetical protein
MMNMTVKDVINLEEKEVAAVREKEKDGQKGKIAFKLVTQ